MTWPPGGPPAAWHGPRSGAEPLVGDAATGCNLPVRGGADPDSLRLATVRLHSAGARPPVGGQGCRAHALHRRGGWRTGGAHSPKLRRPGGRTNRAGPADRPNDSRRLWCDMRGYKPFRHWFPCEMGPLRSGNGPAFCGPCGPTFPSPMVGPSAAKRRGVGDFHTCGHTQNKENGMEGPAVWDRLSRFSARTPGSPIPAPPDLISSNVGRIISASFLTWRTLPRMSCMLLRMASALPPNFPNLCSMSPSLLDACRNAALGLLTRSSANLASSPRLIGASS